MTSTKQALVLKYFNDGFSYNEMISLLNVNHGVEISLRSLHRILRNTGLRRRNVSVDTKLVIRAIVKELEGYGSHIGYRAMHHKLAMQGISVDHETVRLCLKNLDPEGVDTRKKNRLKRRKYIAKGPNYLWHLDGNDKLKPYGFCIHGCIDGYSRKILWLEVSPSNKNPSVVAGYFLDCVAKLNCTARTVRGDRGTENVTIAGMQRFFYPGSPDYLSSFMYGKSTSNQRIEAWWSYLRRYFLQWWMNKFKDLRDSGYFDDTDPIQVECLRFCYYGIIQDELHGVAYRWNCHRIRRSHNAEMPGGRPEALYTVPANGVRDYKSPFINPLDIDLSRTFCKKSPTFGCQKEFAELAITLMRLRGLEMPKTTNEADILYLRLLSFM